MSNSNTSNDTSVKVVSDTREAEILAIFHTLHGKVLTALQECDIKPLFNTSFDKCTNEDYKVCQEQARKLIGAKRKARWEEKVRGIRTAVAKVISTHMSEARTKKAKYDAIPAEHREFLAPFPTSFNIPFSALTSAFPEGTTTEQMQVLLKELSHTVGKGDNGAFIKVAFVPAPTSEQNATKAA